MMKLFWVSKMRAKILKYLFSCCLPNLFFVGLAWAKHVKWLTMTKIYSYPPLLGIFVWCKQIVLNVFLHVGPIETFTGEMDHLVCTYTPHIVEQALQHHRFELFREDHFSVLLRSPVEYSIIHPLASSTRSSLVVCLHMALFSFSLGPCIEFQRHNFFDR